MENTASTVILDRLSRSLKAQGVELKRHQLLAVAAGAFGFRNANAFSAAAADGGLTRERVNVLGDAGNGLVLLQDPIACATFAIDRARDDARADRWIVSPYGNLLDAGMVPSTPPVRGEVRVHYAVVNHRHGTDVHTATTEEALEEDLLAYVEQYWEEAARADEDLPVRFSDMFRDEAVQAYFDAHPDETIDRGETALVVGPIAEAVAPRAARGVHAPGGDRFGWRAGAFAPAHEAFAQEVNALLLVSPMNVAPGVTFGAVHAEVREDARRVVIATTGRFDPAAADDWLLGATKRTVHADMTLDVSESQARVEIDAHGWMDDAVEPEEWIAAIRYLLTGDTPRGKAVIAQFQPQAWQNDWSVQVDPQGDTAFDVTFEILLMGHDAAKAIADHDADELRHAVLAPQWIKDWSGPFEVYVRNAIDESGILG